MASDNRMNEIKDNLKRDVQDLLGESANLVTGLFKQGWCTVRGIADKWKTFAHDVSGAVGDLMKPPFLDGGTEAPPLTLAPEGQPIVTVMESADEHFPVGQRMTLSEAEAKMQMFQGRYLIEDKPPEAAKIAIDYMMEGQTDRYWLPLQIGTGESVLEQMKTYVYDLINSPGEVAQLFENVPPQFREVLHAKFGPQLHADLEKLSTKVVEFLGQHGNITELEQQFNAQAAVMPEKKQMEFCQSMQKAVLDLRRATNTGNIAGTTPQRVKLTHIDAQPEQKPRTSVKVTLRQMKERKTPTKPPKKRSTPEH